MFKQRYQPGFHQQEIRVDGENIVKPSLGHLSSHQMDDNSHACQQPASWPNKFHLMPWQLEIAGMRQTSKENEG